MLNNETIQEYLESYNKGEYFDRCDYFIDDLKNGIQDYIRDHGFIHALDEEHLRINNQQQI